MELDMTSNTKKIKLHSIILPKPKEKFVNFLQERRYLINLSELKKKEKMKKLTKWGFNKQKNYLIKRYLHQSLDKGSIQDDDGTYFPRPIPLPSAHYIQFAEPHILITEWSENFKEWHDIRELIQELEKQAFVSYYLGLYYACFLCSVDCLEYVLKYEYLLKTEDENILENHTFGDMLHKLEPIKLSKYSQNLQLINNIRNGFFHLNIKKMKNSVVELNTKKYQNTKINILDIQTGNLVTRTMDKEYNENTFSIPENEDMSKISHHVYCLLNKITKKLYGLHKKKTFIKKCLRDYETKFKKNKGV